MEPEKLDEEGQPNMEGNIPPERESSLLSLRTLIIAAVGLVLIIILVQGLAAIPYAWWASTQPDPRPTLLPPTGPNLQAAPQQDLQAYQATQQASLNAYTWIDRQAGTVRIPIQRAMELIVQRGLPVTTQSPDSMEGLTSSPPETVDEDDSGFLPGYVESTPDSPFGGNP